MELYYKDGKLQSQHRQKYARVLCLLFLFLSMVGMTRLVYDSLNGVSPDEIILKPYFMATMFTFLMAFFLIVIQPTPATKKEMKDVSEDIRQEMQSLREDNESLRKQLEGETQTDAVFADIINETIDYIQQSPASKIEDVRGYLLYIYQGNSNKLKHAIRHLTPKSPKITSINVYGPTQILPNAEKAEQHIHNI